MPFYEFHCEDCNEDFEIFSHRIIDSESQSDEVSCEKCNSKNIKRKISQSQFQLIGSGWAKDNYTKK